MRLTGRKRSALTTVPATLVLVATAMLVGRGGPAATLESAVGESIRDRAVQVPAVSVGQAHLRASKGTAKLPRSALADLDIPVTALLAYQTAAAVMEQADENCGLTWTLLAAIGRVESDHGRYGGARLRPDGTSSRAIRGVALDGSGPLARIRDTDAAQLDGDAVWDRAVGPMQFLPSTWSFVAVDGDADGVRSPDDIDDAALATAVFLCSAPGDLATQSGTWTAVFRYNPSRAYVASVLAVERSYRAGEFDTPAGLAPVDPADLIVVKGFVQHTAATPGAPGDHGDRDPEHPNDSGAGSDHPDTTTDPTDTPEPDPTDTPEPDPTGPPGPDPSSPPEPDPTDTPGPDPTDTPGPDPTPEPDPVELTGVLTGCGPEHANWCLGDLLLDVGAADFLATAARSDFDADGAVESNVQELTGLASTEVRILAAPGPAPAVVLAINGADYRQRG